MSDSSVDRNPLEALAEEFLERFRRGERPALSEYTSQHPALAAEIRELFPALVMLEDVRPASARADRSERRLTSSGLPLERLGDYRILREIGRGGMGIVYEAEQESLGRHVALKVLPAHALLEPRQLERFQREARSAARLHHTNIVPVFGVGEQDGLHYYVMQFIHGQGLDQVLAVLRRLRQHPRGVADGDPVVGSAEMASAAAVANALLTGVFAAPPTGRPHDEGDAERGREGEGERGSGGDKDSGSEDKAIPCLPLSLSPSPPRSPASPPPSSSCELPAVMSSSGSGQPYWHSVARIGIQVADALAYAHGQGTLHRDIKPANLLLDTQGIVWVTDFGLAKAAGSENLTHTGDVVGTLRYMAPERFRGKADGRSDVYGLGLTLYELLTLEPAFGESERDKLLLQVMQKEPPRPRKLNPAVPRDLETIVLKATARDLQHRYHSAADLAADLQRFTEDKPIRARPVSEVEKLWRWCRRNPSLAVALAAFLAVLVLGLAGTSFMWYVADTERKKSSQAEVQTGIERDKAVRARNETQRLLAGALLDRGIALAEEGEVGEGLLWMHQALETVPPDQDADLARVMRTNIAAWLDHAHAVEQFVVPPEPIRACIFTPDGRLLTGGRAGIQAWDAGRSTAVVKANAAAAMALSPDGTVLVTGHTAPGESASILERWTVATATAIGPPLRHPGEVRALAITPDGKQVVAGGSDGIVRRWDLATGMPVGDAMPHPKLAVWDLAFSPDGRTLAVATRVSGEANENKPARLFLWDLTTGKQAMAPLPHQGMVHSVVFAPDGQRLLTGGEDRTAQIWDARTGQPVGRPLPHSRAVTVVRYAPDGRTIATGSDDGLIRWFDAATGTQLIGTLSLQQAIPFALAFSPDGRHLAVVSDTKRNWHFLHKFTVARAVARPPARQREALARAPWRLGEGETWFSRNWVAHSPDATLVLSIAPHHGRLWDAATGQPRLRAGGPDGPLWNAWSAVDVTAISPDGRLLVTCSREGAAPVGEARLFAAATGRLVATLAHNNYVSAVAFSPDSQLLATGCYDGGVYLWDCATGRRAGAVLPQPDIVISLAFSPDGKTLAVGHAEDRCGYHGVVLWDIAERKSVVPPIKGPGNLVQFSPDGKHLLANAHAALRFYDTATAQPLGPAIEETAEINSAVFDANGQTVLLSTTDGTVWLRHVPSGRPVGAPMRSPVRANVAAFSNTVDARLIVAGYDDGTVRFWDRATQKPLGPPLQQGRRIVAVRFTPDDRFGVASGADGTTRRWPVPMPRDDDRSSLGLRLQARIGFALHEGQSIVPLDPQHWQARHAECIAHGGRTDNAGATDIVYHDLRAREAEHGHDPFAARWHLDRLLLALAVDAPPDADAPPVWQVYARRARLATTAHEFDRAEADYAAALKHGAPDRLVGWYRYRIGDCVGAKDPIAARWYADRALALAPDDWQLYAGRADAMDQLGKAEERDADLARAADHGAEAIFLVQTGDAHAARRSWARAAAAYELAASRGSSDPVSWQHHALVLLKMDNRDGYRKLCRGVVDARLNTDSALVANNAAWLCALGPDGLTDYTVPVALAEQVVRGSRSDGAKAGVLNTLGAVLFRAGRYREAIARLNEGIKLSSGPGANQDWLFLAMAHHRLGDAARARKYLALVTPCPPEHAFSFECLELEVLYHEAQQLIHGG